MRIVLLLAVVLAAACAAPKKEPPPKPFVGTKWVVQLEVPLVGDQQPWFQFGDGLMEGFGGCNRIAARYVQDTVGSRFIAIGRLDRGARGSCEQRAQMVEARTLETLQSVSSYVILLDSMTMSGSGGSLKFLSDPPYPPEEPKK